MPMPALTDVNCSRGAPMGRANSHSTDKLYAGKFYLRQLPMVDYDYDQGGAYWGCGNPEIGWMYRAYSDTFQDEVVELFVRARNREAAKAAVREDYPNAMFFR